MSNELAKIESFGGGRGEFSSREFEKPRLNLVQGVGSLSGLKTPKGETLHAGDFVLMREYKLHSDSEVTVVSFSKSYLENIDPTGEVRPREFQTEEEVLANGGNFDYQKDRGDHPDNYSPIGRLDLMIQVGEDFPIALDFGGSFYTPAIWRVARGAFKSIVFRLNAIEAGLKVRREPLSIVKFLLSAERAMRGHFIPRITKAGTNTPEFVEFVRSIFAS